MRIAKKHEMKLTIVVMVFCMTLIISLVNFALNNGFHSELIYK